LVKIELKKAGAHLLPLCMFKQKTYIKPRKIPLPSCAEKAQLKSKKD